MRHGNALETSAAASWLASVLLRDLPNHATASRIQSLLLVFIPLDSTPLAARQVRIYVQRRWRELPRVGSTVNRD
jgi:hypothetical protein